MDQRAKIFRNGGSQAVRLPKSVRFLSDQREVMVRRAGNRVILEPTDEWPRDFVACLGSWTDDIPRPPSSRIAARRNPFSAP